MGTKKQFRDSSTHCSNLFHVCFSFFVIFNFLIEAHAQPQQNLETDRAALERFKAAVDPTGNILPWVSGTNPCTWTGVQCYLNRVASLRLPRLQLTGSIPDNTLGDLGQLRVLSMHNNRLFGPFPVDLTRCGLLKAVFLGSNMFSGPLPDFTGIWPRMSHINLGFNNFTGEIPASIAALNKLHHLDLQSNFFTGEIPAVSVNNLESFTVANNDLEGPVPTSLQKFSIASFAGNEGLCGPPTTVGCPPTAPALAPNALDSMSGSSNGTPALSTKTRSHLKLGVGKIASIALGSLLILIIIVFIVWYSRRGDGRLDKEHVGKQVTHYNGEGTSPVETSPENKESLAVTISSEPATRSKLVFLDQGKRDEFSLDDLLQASAEVLGKGSVGTSYRANLQADCVMIVKRLKDVAADQKEFETHVEKLGRLRHRHLMPLRAYYYSRDEKLLVTDFMPGGNLHSKLHDDAGSRNPLGWVSREKIALGTARALAYLDKPCVRMPHGDIKSANILLNREYEPCVADHGLVHLLNPVSVSPSRFIGYQAPEVTDIRKFTMQSDVYSFGVLLLELITGRAPERAICKNDAGIDLPKWVRSFDSHRWIFDVVDLELQRAVDFVEEDSIKIIQLALSCTDVTPENRPKMEEVVLLLEDITKLGHVNESSVCPLAAAAAAAKSTGNP